MGSCLLKSPRGPIFKKQGELGKTLAMPVHAEIVPMMTISSHRLVPRKGTPGN